VWTILVGVGLIGFGFLYVKNPGIYRRGIWMKTSVASRVLSEDNYRKYMRGLGIVLIAIGVALLAWGLIGEVVMGLSGFGTKQDDIAVQKVVGS
jgi:Ca2+/Na+ antiporter